MNTLAIAIPDRTYGQEDDTDWEVKSSQLKAELDAEFHCVFERADIWPGASLPAFLLELPQEAWPYLAKGLYTFFKGKDI